MASQHLIEDPVKYAINTVMTALTDQHEKKQAMRNTTRMSFNLPITLHEKTEWGAYKHLDDAFGLDISHLGVGFISSTLYRKNTLLHINLKPIIGRPFFLPISITHSTKAFGANFMSGGKFVFEEDILTYSEDFSSDVA